MNDDERPDAWKPWDWTGRFGWIEIAQQFFEQSRVDVLRIAVNDAREAAPASAAARSRPSLRI